MWHRPLCVVLLLIGLASPCLARVIGDFEADMQDWYVPSNANIALLYSTSGATLNYLSLRVQAEAGGWQNALALELVGQDELSRSFLENTVLAVDVTRLASEWLGDPENGYSQMWMVVDGAGPDASIRDQYVAGDWTPDQGDQTQTLVFDYSSALSQINMDNLWWLTIRLVINYDEDYTTGGTYYLDNIRLLNQSPQSVIWVSSTMDINSDGVQDDLDWVKMLRAAGYDVDVRLDYWKELDSAKVDELNAADLIITSRSTNSADYATNDEEITLWNGVATPLIQTNAYMLRSSRWKWINSSGVTNVPAPLMAMSALDHRVLEGIDLDVNQPIQVLDGAAGANPADAAHVAETSFPSLTTTGNGTVLASTVAGNVWISEWDRAEEFYIDSGQFAGGQRMMFMAGTQEISGTTPQGVMNLTDSGQQLFLNTVTYMLSYKISDPGIENLVHAYRFEDGTARDAVGQAHGILAGNAQIQNGALVIGSQGDWMEIPGYAMALNTFEGLTLEAWHAPSMGANPGRTMLAYFGDSSNGTAHDGVFLTSAWADGQSRTAISVGNTITPWDTESGIGGPGYDDGQLHHIVATLNETHIALYLDGQLAGITRLSANNDISGISPNLAYLARSGYADDPEWIGQIHEFNIYNKALIPGEVAFLANK